MLEVNEFRQCVRPRGPFCGPKPHELVTTADVVNGHFIPVPQLNQQLTKLELFNNVIANRIFPKACC